MHEGEEEAVSAASDVACGLAAGVWTNDIARAFLVSNAIEAGTIWVNTCRAVGFTSPLGGYERSGIGRESGGEMIREFPQTKSVWIATQPMTQSPFVIR